MITRICTVAIAAVVSGTLGLWVGDKQIPFVQQWAEIAPNYPVEGQEIAVTWHGVRFKNYPGTVYRQIVDYCKEVHVLEPVNALYSPSDTENSFTRAFRMPAHIAHGPATYSARTEFANPWNPLHRLWPIVSYGIPIKFNIGDPSEIMHCGPTDPTKP